MFNQVINGNRVLWFLLRGLGIPQGQSGSDYRNVATGLVFIPAGIICLLHSHLAQFQTAFWVSFVIGSAAISISTRRALLVAGLFAVLATRFIVGFALTLDFLWLLAALVCAAGAIGLVKLDKS
jgi:hypothetical protein